MPAEAEECWSDGEETGCQMVDGYLTGWTLIVGFLHPTCVEERLLFLRFIL